MALCSGGSSPAIKQMVIWNLFAFTPILTVSVTPDQGVRCFNGIKRVFRNIKEKCQRFWNNSEDDADQRSQDEEQQHIGHGH